MKSYILIVFAALGVANADTFIAPTLPGTSIRDYSKPGYVQEGNNTYPTLPGTSIRDYTRPGYVEQGNKVYQTLPGTNIRDYTVPGYQIERQ